MGLNPVFKSGMCADRRIESLTYRHTQAATAALYLQAADALVTHAPRTWTFLIEGLRSAIKEFLHIPEPARVH
jgi:hypothetical protein